MADRREWDKALADLNEAIRLDPKDAGLFPGRAISIGSWENARRPWPITRNDSARSEIRVGLLGSRGLYRDSKDFDKALAAYDEAIRIAPEYARFSALGRPFTATEEISRRPWPIAAK